jgi:MFS family permease
MAISTYACKTILDSYMKTKAISTGRNNKPEDRLPLVIIGGVMMSAGLFLYGWTSQYHVFWLAPVAGSGMLGFGLIAVNVSSITYVVDLFGLYAASGVAGLVVMKNISGSIFPLVGPPLFQRLGYGWGSTLLGLTTILFLPAPMLLFKYGETMRKGNKFSAAI